MTSVLRPRFRNTWRPHRTWRPHMTFRGAEPLPQHTAPVARIEPNTTDVTLAPNTSTAALEPNETATHLA